MAERGRPRHPRLSRERVIAAATALADEAESLGWLETELSTG